MTDPNPFDDPDGRFRVLRNAEGQYSLWPDFAELPAGWDVVHTGARHQCLEHIEAHWTDLRPHGTITTTTPTD